MGASAFLFLLAISNYRIAQKINNTATSKVRSAAIGLSEFRGSVVAKKLIYSPLTATPCVYWYAVYQRNAPKTEKTKLSESVPFLLEDETGAILVDPKDAIVDIVENKYSSKDEADIELRVSELLRDPKCDPAMKKALKENSDPDMRALILEEHESNVKEIEGIREYCIKEGDRLYVLGTVRETKGPRGSGGHHDRLAVGAGEHEKMFYITNSPERKISKEMKRAIRDQLFYAFILLLFGILSIIGLPGS